ncbi:GATA zinc finger domain-containing protein 10 [Heracleum sosnowskyi]|uniref:GATA zinc finger domain-containing protein 10 n=1 Tax=Heracleum sosnowskyi TaxID=360622 RepID=A0AAD8M6M7_9APIA|nr:GATA zinc finger domain-containing protein 10 [Heracleum sosnowskyi]
MAMVNMSSSSCAFLRPLNQSTNLPISFHYSKPSSSFVKTKTTTIKTFSCKLKSHTSCQTKLTNQENPNIKLSSSSETQLYSINPLPLLIFAALPGAGTVKSLFGPFVELVQSWNLPGWLVHWGHPGNMAVVLFAMGGYGTYLGFRIRFSDDMDEKAMAKDLHPKLLAGMFFFFALGATGGVTALLTSDKPIFESPHAVTGLIGLSLLTIQTILPSLFEGNPSLRNVHGILGSSIMTLFVVHAALGLQLGLSF